MTEFPEIGGFLPLDISKGTPFHQNAIGLNTARNALAWFLKHTELNGGAVKMLLLPAFVCPEVIEMVESKFPQFKLQFYNIDERLEPLVNRDDFGEALFYFYNSFGLKGDFARHLPANSIVDNAHSFYSPHSSGHITIYSARKFFGVPDGAYLYSDDKIQPPPKASESWQRNNFLLKAHDVGARQTYHDFLKSEDDLSKAEPSEMSPLSKKLLAGFDYANIGKIRLENFNRLHNALGQENGFRATIDEALLDQSFVPFSYPWLHPNGSKIREQLIERNIFIPCLWNGILESDHSNSFEKHLVASLVHLPVDQRYGAIEVDHMQTLIDGLNIE
jgi:hypothetical protein